MNAFEHVEDVFLCSFEFDYTSKAGKNYGALGGGGHYSNLMQELGGPDLPGVGFSLGIERLYDVLKDDGLMSDDNLSLDVYVMPLGKEVSGYALNIANKLRLAGYSTDYCFDDVKLGNMFKRASKKNAKYAIIIGDNEYNNRKLVVKDLRKEEQVEIDEDNIVSYFDAIFNQEECCCKSNGECCSNEECK